MQVTENVAAGLKRELSIVIGRGELDRRFVGRLSDVKNNIQLKGFRKGKVPESHIRKLYGRSIMAEVLQEALDETSRKAIADRNERPAFQPKIDLTEDKDEIEKVISGQSDLAYRMSFEVLPTISIVDFTTLSLERETADVEDTEVEKGLKELAERATTFEEVSDRVAVEGDQVTIDFVGRIDGTEFPGGKAEATPVVIGRGGFIPGFEEGLKGTKAGDSKTIEATFPADYPEKSLAGKTALFETTVKSVSAAKVPALDDELAKKVGLESIDRLKDVVRAQIANQYAQVSRMRLKRRLLDQLDKAHSFDLPETLVSNEFDGIWRQVESGLKQAGKTFESEGKTEEQARAEYRTIAERRVRLGLVIGEIGDKQKIQVTQDELRGALMEQARQFPGQEKMVYDFYQKNPNALTELRAPLFEDKVVDFIIDAAKPTEKKISREELMKPMADDEAVA
jgi:trigger factor